MAELTTIQHAILEVLSTQSSGYLASPNASAFVAIGLGDVGQVHEALVEMQNNGWVEYYEEEETTTIISIERDSEGNPIFDDNGAIIPILDENGNVKTETVNDIVDSGWILTDEGRKALE